MSGRGRTISPSSFVLRLALLLLAAGLSFSAPVETPASMTELGKQYQNGIGCPRDIGKALFWYKRAATANDPGAMVALGDLYDAGVCVPEDLREAVRYYRRAAELGFAPGMVRMATMTERGRGLRFVREDMVAWYRQAAAKGYGPAMIRLAELEEAQAEDWLRKAVAAEVPSSFAKLAILVEDKAEASRLYRQGAELGDGAALAAMGREAEGQNQVDAARWYHQAAEAGDAFGAARYAEFLERGLGGVKQSTGDAVVWYRKAAAAGELSALTRMGELQEQGLLVKRDLNGARALYKSAVDANYAPAMVKLGRLINAEEPTRAQELFRAAAESGNPDGMVHYAATLPAAESEDWYRRAAQWGQPKALAHLGRVAEAANAGHVPSMLQAGLIEKAARAGSPEGMRRYAETLGSTSEAAIWLLRAAEAGDVRAMGAIGVAYLHGIGIKQDSGLARHWLTKASEHRDPEGLFALAALDNDAVLFRKAAEAGYGPAMIKVGESTGDRSWFQRAADAGYANGWTKLGEVEQGASAGDPEAKMLLGDRARHPQEAYKLYAEAAAAGYLPAMIRLGDCHLQARGTYRSEVDALGWFRRAAEAGSAAAASKARELELRLH